MTLTDTQTDLAMQGGPLSHRPHDPADSPGGPPSVESMLMLAIERGVDPANLERLVALHERVTARRAEQAFNEAMAAFRAKCPAILKVKVVSFQTRTGNNASYHYAPLEEITKIVDPVLHEQGLTYHWDAKTEGRLTTVICHIHHIDGHSRSSQFACEGAGSPLMNAAQVSASAVTFARRYSLILALGLTTDEDDDGRRAAPRPSYPPNPAAPRVGTRQERSAEAHAAESDADAEAHAQGEGADRVTADTLNELFEEWAAGIDPKPPKSRFVAWCQDQTAQLGAGDLSRPSNWTPERVKAVREKMQ